MKPLKIKFRNPASYIIASIVILVTISCMSGCTKPETTFENFEASNLRIINGLPGKEEVAFFLDKYRLENTEYENFPSYLTVYSGPRHAAFYSEATLDTFATTNIQLTSKKNYSLFLAGSTGNPKFILTEDDLSQPAPDKAKIRMANLSLSAGNVDLTIQLESAAPNPEVVVFSNVAGESVSDYTLATVPASKGNALPNPHTLRIYEAGTANLLAEINEVDLRGTSINTIILTGVNGGQPGLVLRSMREWLNF